MGCNTKIILVDNHPLFREGIKLLIEMKGLGKVIGECANNEMFLDLLVKLQPDLVFIDIDLSEKYNKKTFYKATELNPGTKFIAFTMFGDTYDYSKIIDLGVQGLILKSSGIDEIEKAISEVLKGKSYFSAAIQLGNIRNSKPNNSNKNSIN